MSYEFHWPTRTIFGAGAAADAGHYPEPPSSEAATLIVTHDEAWAKSLAQRLKPCLQQAGWSRIAVFPEIEPNPSWETVSSGVKAAASIRAHTVLGVGGGSVMDASKVITQRADAAVLVTMPTTAGSGGEISPWAVISNLERREKESVVAHWPDLALLDPELSLSLPPSITLLTAIDAFIHGLEAYLSSEANPTTDLFALHGMRLVADHLTAVVQDGSDLEARGALLRGSLYTGAAMLHAGLGLMHAIGNVAGGLYHQLPHGLVLYSCLQAVMRFNEPAIPPEKLDQVAPLLTVFYRQAESLVAREKISTVSIQKEDLHLLIERALENVNAQTNPHAATAEEISAIIQESFHIQSATTSSPTNHSSRRGDGHD
jgi:alcohol dehydrogenase class IV